MTPHSVGIMSMQRIFNYGSSLQAYGLRRLVESIDPSLAVSYLDYRPGATLVPTKEPTGRLRRTSSKIVEYGRTDGSPQDTLRFFNHKRRYASRYLPMVGISPEKQFHQDVATQIIGSDEVFNCVQSNTNVGYSRDLFGRKTSAKQLASYAASFGNTTLEKIGEAGVTDSITEDLLAFDFLSVRDRNSRDIVESLTGTAPEINVDPVLAYPFMTAESRIPRQRQHAKPYIIVYGYSGRFSAEENRSIREYADSIGADVLSFGGLQRSADRFIDCNPFELLAYVRDSIGVITDTFHGSIFAVINEKPFCTVVRKSTAHGYGNEEKLGYLLGFLGLQQQRADLAGSISGALSQTIDYNSVNVLLGAERQRSTAYLRRLFEAK